MTVSASVVPALPRAASALACLVLGLALSGCADMSDSMTTAFADPAQYDLYDCKQLEAARKTLDTRAAQLQGLMAKAETGTGGVVVAELAYRNDYLAVRGQSHFAEQAWRKNHCHETPPGAATAGPPTPPVIKPAPPSRSGSAVY
ncbi:MAG TPA: twin-arginine translocation pathway signal [Bradyrhizobium sp.]|uniref:twin-arginine translocation pathway signal n=1 Tax=Bradyrhizobium sp. TaxID=376 RepID=UPI002C148804|nr:twin-arginine translocation pathway signal [Bradyrhizobium sp.]HLZ05631.1 twin-arginine translocation pathway signal [Bradyrhizobium sp.]